jgi:hypothetical protein
LVAWRCGRFFLMGGVTCAGMEASCFRVIMQLNCGRL